MEVEQNQGEVVGGADGGAPPGGNADGRDFLDKGSTEGRLRHVTYFLRLPW